MSHAAHGMVLFAHGARDARWAEPFERLLSLVRAARLAAGDHGPVALAYLELMQPDLPGAIGEHHRAGCAVITVVPVFFGRGGHLRRDLPALIDVCRAAYPTLEIRCATAVGESEAVLSAISGFCIEQLGG